MRSEVLYLLLGLLVLEVEGGEAPVNRDVAGATAQRGVVTLQQTPSAEPGGRGT